MRHLSEEELVSLNYGEADAHTARHVEVCKGCAESYAALRADLAELKFPEPPERDDQYGESVWARLSRALPALQRNHAPSHPWKVWGYAIACVLLAACTFSVGRFWERRQSHHGVTAQTTQTQAPSAQSPPRVVVVVLSDHLGRSERLLVQLKHADAENHDLLTPLQEEARKLLAANHACRLKAIQSGDADLASALDRLDHVLQELAKQPAGHDTTALTRLQHEVNADDLLFEVRVLRSKLTDSPTVATTKPKGKVI
jgi:hypothetical protein